jgi:uncharacterized protein YcaQ
MGQPATSTVCSWRGISMASRNQRGAPFVAVSTDMTGVYTSLRRSGSTAQTGTHAVLERRPRYAVGVPTTLSAHDARVLLMQGQGLLDDPARRATIATLSRLIHRMGYVQLDSINVLERAHHLTLATRLDGYRPAQLARLLEERRTLFEHWTHDAAALPIEFFPMWKNRFERYAERPRLEGWLHSRLGKDPQALIEQVLERVRTEGPLMSKDFKHESVKPRNSFWGWKPQKAALEHLWWSGRLSVSGRRDFQKVYDLTERVLPEAAAEPGVGHDKYLDWACGAALDRLGVATAAELAEFWGGVTAREASAWSQKALQTDRARAVGVLAAKRGGKPRAAIAVVDFEKRIRRAPTAPDRIRLLCPFDPVLRNRRRLEHFFGFDYRFEGFVPPAKRRHGYYVLAILEGERLVGRLDPKFVREEDTLVVRRIFWEAGTPATSKRRRKLRLALEDLAGFVGASRVSLPQG